MPFRLVVPQLLEVTYESSEQMAPAEQKPLLDAREFACTEGPTVIVFYVRKITSVDLAVPAMWQHVTKRLAPGLTGMAICSTSLAVRTAASTFGIANMLTRVPVEVRAFEGEPDGLAWAKKKLGDVTAKS